MGMNTESVQRLYVAYFNRPADPVSLQVYESMLPADRVATQAELQALAEQYFSPSAEYQSFFAGMSNSQIVDQLYQNIFGRPAEYDGLVYWAAELTAGRQTVASLALQLSYSAQGTDADVVANRIEAASAFTTGLDTTEEVNGFAGDAAAASARTWLATVGSDEASKDAAISGVDAAIVGAVSAGSSESSQAFILTSGADNLKGGAGDDTFDASLNSNGNQTLNSLDSVDAGAGTDTLSVQLTGSASPVSLAGVEVVNLEVSGAATLDLRNASSLTDLSVLGATAATTVSNVIVGTDLSISDTTQNITIGSSGATGAADAASVTLAAVTGAADISLAGIELVTINSVAASNSIDLVAVDAETLTLTGDAAITIGDMNTSGATEIYTIDASGSTGAVTLTTGNLSQVAPSQDVTITGGTAGDDFDVSGHTTSDLSVSAGAGNDRVTAAPGAGDTLAGGEGTDTLELTAAVAAPNANITGFEALQLTGNVSQDADNISGNSIASVTIAATGNAGLTDAPASATGLVLNSAAVGNNTGTITLDLKTDTGDDTVNITAAGATSATVTVNDAETINVNSGIAASIITTMNAADATAINVTGTEDLTIGTLAGNVSLATIDATGSTGAVSVAGTANGSLVPMTILAGSGGLTADGSGRDDTVTGGAGADAIDAGDGNDTLVGNGGADDLDGEAGNDNISGGAGGDTLTVGAGIDTVDGGDGADTIVLAGNYTTLDSIDGGAGTDTVTITTPNGSLTPVFTNVEAVTMTASAGGANTLVLTSSTSVDSVTVADGADVATVINSLGGGTVTNEDTGNTLTVDTTAGAALTVSAEANNANALTITDAASVTLKGAAASAGFGSLTLDAVDTTSLTISSAAATLDYDTGVVSGSDQLQTLTVTTAGAGGDITVGDMADADSLTSITVTASAGDVDIAEVGGTGSAASGTAEALATITVNASQGGTVVFDEIFADTTNSVSDNDMVITASANDAGSSVAFGVVNNQFGSITATLSGTQAVDFTEGTATMTADSVTITRSGDGATTIDAVDATTTFTATNNSSGTLTITTSDAEGDTVVTTTSGALDVTTTSTDNVTLTGGSQADTLAATGTTESGKTHTLDGGGGADAITGGGGNDVLIGGAGNDTITAGAGIDNIDGGDGNDTITMSTNLVSTDTIEGGAGTDSLTASIAANYSGTITGVETFTIDATAADSGTFSFANIDSEATVIVTADTTNDAIVLGDMASGTTVRIADDQVNATVDTVADASVTVDVRSAAATAEPLTVTDAANVTITTGASANSATLNLVLDAVDTDTLTVTNPTAITLATGAITGTNVLQSVTATSSVGSGTITLGTIADADGLTSVTLTASEANAAIGQIGTDATANNAETLTTIDVSASGTGVTATLGDVYLDSTVDSTTDNTVTVTSTSQTGATAAMGLIDNTYGTINATYTAEGSNTTTTLTGVAMTIASSGAGSNTISTLNGTGVVSVTSTGSGTFEITDANVDGASASLTVDGSEQTGTIDVTATNSTAAVTLTGGAGADTLIGGSGNDSLVGGAGADAITLNGGFDTVEAGAGNDTITVGGNISLTDNIDGGDGTDTVTATIDTATVHQFGTLNNIETLTLTYGAAGTFKANDVSASTINMTASAGVAAIMNNIGTGKTVRLENNNLSNVTLDYTADATAVIQLSTDTAVNAGNLTVTDAQTVTIQAHNDDGTAVSHDLGTVTLDATDTDFVTVSSAATGVTFTTTGAFAADDAQTLTVTAGHDGTTLSLGSGSTVLATADKLTAITLSAEVENDADIVITDLGTTAAAAALETITITASADSTIASASGADITTGAIDAAGADLTSITLSANYTGSVITIDAGAANDQLLADSVSTFTISAVSGATVDVAGGVDITTIGQLAVSGAGTIRLDSTDNDTATLERVDSTVTGTFTANFHQTTDVVTYTLGTGTNTITTGTANDVVYLTAAGGTDDIALSTSSTGSITIHNFQVGASADDIILSITGINTGVTGDIVNLDTGDADKVTAADAVSFETVTGATDLAAVTADTNVLVLNGDVASTDALETALEVGGTFALTAPGDGAGTNDFVAGDTILVLYDDGTDSFLAAVTSTAGADNTTFAASDLTAVNLITFIGISDVTTIVEGNFGAIVA